MALPSLVRHRLGIICKSHIYKKKNPLLYYNTYEEKTEYMIIMFMKLSAKINDPWGRVQAVGWGRYSHIVKCI